jgi:hypothetical protein
MDSSWAVMMDVIRVLVARGVQPEQYYAELGSGQQGLCVRYADALRAADNQLTVRDTVRAVAARHGLLASFAPKPFADQAGNGSHIHFSLWRMTDRMNDFHATRGPHVLSQPSHAFMGGVLAHLGALLALAAPTVNSNRRLQPRFWSSAYMGGNPTTGKRPCVHLPDAAAWRCNPPTLISRPAIPLATPTSRSADCWGLGSTGSSESSIRVRPRWSIPARAPRPSGPIAESAATRPRSPERWTRWNGTR